MNDEQQDDTIEVTPIRSNAIREMRDAMDRDPSTMSTEERLERAELVIATLVETNAALLVSVVESAEINDQTMQAIADVLNKQGMAIAELLANDKSTPLDRSSTRRIITLDQMER